MSKNLNVFYICHKPKLSGYYFVCVVWSLDDNKPYYLFYTNVTYHYIYDCYRYNEKFLRIHDSFDSPYMRVLDLSDCDTFTKHDIVISDFPQIELEDISRLTKYTKYVGPAVCACGYVNEYLENVPNYVCSQCKLWKHVSG